MLNIGSFFTELGNISWIFIEVKRAYMAKSIRGEEDEVYSVGDMDILSKILTLQ